MKRKTLEYAKEIFSNKGLTILSTEYKSMDTPMVCVDEYGYLYYRTLRTVEKVMERTKGNYSHKFSKKNKFYWENILYYMQTEVKNGTKLVTKKELYKDTDSLLTFVCGECGLPFKKSLHSFVNLDNKICSSCYKKMFSKQEFIEERRNDKEVYIERAKEKGLIILDGNFSNMQSKVDVEDKEGFRARITLSTLSREVGFDKFSTKNPYTIYNIRHYAEIKGYGVVIPDQEYFGDKKSIKVICSCGNTFYRTINHCISDVGFYCNQCRATDSKISIKVENWLKENNIDYIKEKTFENCYGDKKLLRFDFYLSNYHSCIEVDGLHHFKPIFYSKLTKKDAIENFHKRKKYDAIKNIFCKENNIPLLRIPFWKIEKSAEYIDEIKNFLST